jgi:hypothetical protein
MTRPPIHSLAGLNLAKPFDPAVQCVPPSMPSWPATALRGLDAHRNGGGDVFDADRLSYPKGTGKKLANCCKSYRFEVFHCARD